MCVVALLLGMLMANMLKDVCGCNVVEGNGGVSCFYWHSHPQEANHCVKKCADYIQFCPFNDGDATRRWTSAGRSDGRAQICADAGGSDCSSCLEKGGPECSWDETLNNR